MHGCHREESGFEQSERDVNKSFPINDLDDFEQHVGHTFVYDRKLGTMTVSQLACIERLLARFDIIVSRFIPAYPTAEL